MNDGKSNYDRLDAEYTRRIHAFNDANDALADALGTDDYDAAAMACGEALLAVNDARRELSRAASLPAN